MKTVRNVIKIDEEKCDGCGVCIPTCPEQSLKIVNGKARLVSETYCDGLGACIDVCPQGAITVEEREAEESDEEAVRQHPTERSMALMHGRAPADMSYPPVISSALSHWPIQLMLVHPRAPFFEDADLMVVADCVPFAYANFHQDFLKGKSVVIGCPKFDDTQSYEKKLTELFRQSNVRCVTVVNMEVPCCYGLHFLVQSALQVSGKNIPIEQVTISVKGERKR